MATSKSLSAKLNYYKKAFSLSEVLLTLVIIGVLGAVLHPIVIAASGRHETVVRVNKAHSVVNQGLEAIAYEQGLPVGDMGFLQAGNEKFFFERFVDKVDTIKVCGEVPTGCFATSQVTKLNGNPENNFDVQYSLVTKDGMAYGWNSKASCESKGLSSEDLDLCVGSFIVDINGDGTPNRYGYDIFFFPVIDTKGIVPAGRYRTTDCNRRSTGMMCASRVIDKQAVDYR